MANHVITTLLKGGSTKNLLYKIMVRTKGDGAVMKAVGAKAPRKQLVSNTGASSSAYSSNDSNKRNKPSTGLPYCPQPTPDWQKSIKSFFTFKSKDDDKENEENEKGTSSDIEVTESKGKQLEKSSKKGKGLNKSSKSAKKVMDKNEDDEMNGTRDQHIENSESPNASQESDEGKGNGNTSDQEETPVKRKRNQIIESDEDE